MSKLYRIDEGTLKEIGNAIREKTGTQEMMSPAIMPTRIRQIEGGTSNENVPEDIVAEAQRLVDRTVDKITSNNFTFVAMSDMHEFGDGELTNDGQTPVNPSTIEQYRRANKNAGQAAKIVSDKIKLDLFAYLGDFAWGSAQTTVTQGVQSIVSGLGYIQDVSSTNKTFITPGNHDSLVYSKDKTGEVLSYNVLSGLIGTYQYADCSDKKLRVICLNTADNSQSINAKEGLSGKQLQWFAEALDLSAKEDAAEWKIIILSHHPLDWGENKIGANCLAAYIEGVSYSLQHADGTEVYYDFTGKNAAEVVAQFHGHVHGFRYDYINDFRSGAPVPTSIYRIAIPNACYGRNNEYGENPGTDSNGIEFGETESYEKEDNGTGHNTSFCLVTINPKTKIIYANCFGAGYDRIVQYGEGEKDVYNITYNLSNVTTSNTIQQIVEGESYTTTLTPEEYCQFDTITITMGGQDITNSVYNNGIITINSVTGDIVITATATITTTSNLYEFAEEKDSTAIYNNGLGYKNGTYVSENASSNFDGTDSEFVATGFIPYVVNETGLPKIIQISGADWIEGKSHCRLYFFDSAKSKCLWPLINGTGEGGDLNTNFLSYSYNIVSINDGFELIPKATSSRNWTALSVTQSNSETWVGNCGYLRLSLFGRGENLRVVFKDVSDSDFYSITNILTNAINSNTNTEIIRGSSYQATITAKSGYELQSVQVQMNGVDITTSAYTNGQINIDSVNGNIVINAVATKKESDYPDNLVPTATSIIGGTEIFNEGLGYKNNTRVSESAPYYKDNAGTVTVGFLPFGAGDEIYIKGATVGADEYVRFYTYSASGASYYFTVKLESEGATSWKDQNNNIICTIEYLGDNYLKLIPNPNVFNQSKYYYHLSLLGSGDNLVIQHNKPIE